MPLGAVGGGAQDHLVNGFDIVVPLLPVAVVLLSDLVLLVGGLLADLESATLSFANVTYANLTYTNFGDANLSYADLTDATVYWTDFSGANVDGTTGYPPPSATYYNTDYVLITP